MRLIFFALLACFMPSRLFGQHKAALKIQSEPIDVVWQMCSSQQSVWTTTKKGLYRFNGWESTWITETEGLPENQVASVYPSDSGLWVGFMRLGLYHYNPQQNRFIALADTSKGYPVLPDYRVGAILEVSDTGIWYQSHHFGVVFSHFQKAQSKVYTPSDFLNVPVERGLNIIKGWLPHPKNSSIRVAFGSAGVYGFDINRKEFLWYKKLDEKIALNKEQLTGLESIVRSMVILNNKLYLGSWGGGLLIADLDLNSFQQVLIEEKYPISGSRNNVRNVTVLNDSTLLLSTNLGLGYYHIHQGRFQLKTDLQGNALIKNPWTATTDSAGTWVVNSEALYLIPKKELPYTFYGSQRSVVDYHKIDNGLEYLAFYQQESELGKRENESYRVLNFSLEKKARVPQSTAIHGWNGKVVLVGKKDFHLLKDDQIIAEFNLKKLSGDESAITSSFINQKRDLLFIATKAGIIHRFNLNTNQIHSYPIPQRRQWVQNFIEIEGSVFYIGEHGFGKILDHSITYTDAEALFKKAGIPKDIFVKMVADRRHIFLGTSKYGVLVLNKAFEFKKHLSLNDRFVEDIKDIALLGDKIYLAGQNGLHAMDSTGKNYFFKGAAYGLDSLLWCKTIGPELILGGYKGLYITDSSILSFQFPGPQPFLSQLEVMGMEVPISGNIELAYFSNWVEARFGARSMAPNQSIISYRLFPQKDWRECKENTQVSFPSLAPGYYELQVKSALPNEEAKEESLLIILVKPAWWQTWWFRILVAAILLASVIFYYRTRIGRLLKQQQIKNELHRLEMQVLRVQMNPHFLFNALNSVRFFVLKSDKKTASEYLSKFSKLLRFILNITTKDRISIAEEMEGLRQYLEFEKLRFEGDFNYQITIGEGLDINQTAIQPLLTQPFVENSIWHGFQGLDGSAKLDIQIEQIDDVIVVNIQDNGIGRKAAAENRKKAHSSKALSITQERLQALQEKSGVKSGFRFVDLTENGKATGTRVEITFPYESINR
ncbi:MAG: histidine kinase [Luteibaculum sp.]